MREHVPSLKGPWLAEGWATPLASSVTVPDPTEAPVQALEAVKNVNVTVPVGVPKAPARRSEERRVGTAGTVTTGVWLATEIQGRASGVRAGTVSGSHCLSVAVRHTSLVSDWSSDVCSADLGPWLAEGWATPLASSVTVPDPTEAPVQALEAVKNVNVTVPVGVPKAPAR